VEAERQRLLQASRDEAARLVAQAKAEIEAETKRAKAVLREEAAGSPWQWPNGCWGGA